MKPAFLRSWTLKTVLLVFFMNTAANFFFWYSSIWWYDMLMHFLGGLFVAVLAYDLCWHLMKTQRNLWVKFFFIIAAVLFIGLLWEVYEFGVQDIAKVTGIADIPDSISDLVFDTIGGIFGFLLVSQRLKNEQS
jgi:hypothetical protein